MERTHKRYKTNYQKHVCQDSKIRVGDEVHIDRPQNDPFASNAFQKEHTNLIRRKQGPYKVTEARSHMGFIREDGILSRAATNRSTLVLKSPKDKEHVTKKDNGLLIKTVPTPDRATKDAKKRRKRQKVGKYVVSHIVHRVQRLEGINWVGCWYA